MNTRDPNKTIKEEWLSFIWPGFHWYQGIAPMYAWQKDLARFGVGVSRMAITYSRGTSGWYFIKDEYESHGKKFFDRVKIDPEIMIKILDQVDLAADQIFKLGNKWKEVNFQRLSDKSLIAYHKKLFHYDEILWRNGQPQNLLEFHNSLLSNHVKSLIKSKSGSKSLVNWFGILTTPIYDSITEQQDVAFVKLFKRCAKLSIKKTLFHKIIKRHALNYTWMSYGWAGPSLSKEYFLNNIELFRRHPKELKRLQRRITKKNEALKKQEVLLKKFSPADRSLIVLLRLILESKAKRVDAHSLTYFLAEKMMLEIGRRVGLTLSQMRVVMPSEVPALFRKFSLNKINREYNFVMYWYKAPNEPKKLSGENGLNKMSYITDRLPKVNLSSRIVGETGYQGKVVGVVRIILDMRDAGAFRTGEVLITRMTDPSYLPIMKRARAIVTEIGGITSHAAIMARELRKPCVIGAINASKILKNGDRVEIDANKGTIRKLAANSKG